MTINGVISKIREIKPNQYSDDVLVDWISAVEQKVFLENIVWHVGADEVPPLPYDPETDKDTVLLIPEPYSGVYQRYLEAQIDYYNGDHMRYINSMTMFNTALSEYVDFYNRTHMPKATYVKV